jgi:hypothetical protein
MAGADAFAAIKGLSFNTTAATIRRKASSPGFAAWHAALPAATRALVDSKPVANEWLPVERYADLIEVAFATAYDRQLETLTAHGREGIVDDLRGAYALFIKLLTPDFTIRRAAAMWTTYYRKNGTVSARPLTGGQRGADVCYRGIVIPSPVFWAVTVGTLEGILSVIRVKDPRVEIVEGGGSAGDCVVRCTWA